MQEKTMPNRVDSPAGGTRPEVARLGSLERAQEPAQQAAPEQTVDLVELSSAAHQQAQTAPAQSERGADQDPPSAQENTETASTVNSQTQNQAAQLRAQQESAQQPAQAQEPGNLVDVTG
ncbi:MAG: hypothetical protein CME19_09105 [Gemmatimonadetes bacterium]|nr:hypothetical protein [Gemmatimonadota bacterium]